MTTTSTINYLFPYPVVVTPPNPQLQLEPLIELCYNERSLDEKGVHFSNQGGWQSKDNPFAKPELNPLTETLMGRVKEAFSNLPLLTNRIEVTKYWINISPPGAFNWEHSHPGADWAGVFYLKSEGAKSGHLYFPMPAQRNVEIMYYTKEYRESVKVGSGWSYEPVPGSTVLFPASLPHLVRVNEGESDRISLSFNINLMG